MVGRTTRGRRASIDASAVVRYDVLMPWTMLTTTSSKGAEVLR
jgi:hypothetical protein